MTLAIKNILFVSALSLTIFACAEQKQPTPAASNESVQVETNFENPAFFDTTLNNHKVIVALPTKTLIGDQENLFSVYIDGQIRPELNLSTDRKEGVLMKSTTMANMLVIVPNPVAPVVNLTMFLPDETGVQQEIGSVALPVQ